MSATIAALSPAPLAASRSISCTRGKRGEPRDPRLGVGGLDGERLALHELDDAAALEIDGGNQHRSVTGGPECSVRRRYCFNVAHAGLGVVKDRRRQRGVRAAVREDVGEVLEGRRRRRRR